jgi:Trk K+ transport system NAD-binding subunit
MTGVLFLALRRLRAPLIALIAIYALAILGLVLIPSQDAAGNPTHMGFFHALYFVSYTATTIGFGELPLPFTAAQRLWVTFMIYASVVGWAFVIGKLLALFNDKGFVQAVRVQRFAARVRQMGEPFYLVAGYGETGQLLCRALDRLDLRFVVLDVAEDRIAELGVENNYRTDPPALAADASQPETLLLAGLRHSACQGVIALTNSDSANLAAAIAVRLLNPSIPVLARADSRETAANMASFGTEHIVYPFERFGEYLASAIDTPASCRLMELLVGVPGWRPRPDSEPPHGRWVVCGYGRFGREVVKSLNREGLDVTIIEPDQVEVPGLRRVHGQGTEAHTLVEAGVLDAVGIVAGTDDDVNNLSIAMTAVGLKHDLYVVLRQNLHANRALFEAFRGHLVMVPSEIIAHEIFALITTPLMARFLEIIKQKDNTWAEAVALRLFSEVGLEVSAVWSVRIDRIEAPAVLAAARVAGAEVALEVLLRDPSLRDRVLTAVPLLLVRAAAELLLPEATAPLQPGDHVLFAGTRQALALQRLILHNVNALDYVRTGRDAPGGWIWQWLNRRQAA